MLDEVGLAVCNFYNYSLKKKKEKKKRNKNEKRKRKNESFSFIFHRFYPFICCLSVLLWLDNGDFPENMHILCVRVKINKRSFEPFLCLDLYSYSFCCACFFRTESISIHSTQSENSLVGTADGVDWTDSDRN